MRARAAGRAGGGAGGLQDLGPRAWGGRPAARTGQGGPRCLLQPLQDKSSALTFPVRVRGKGFVRVGNCSLGQVDRASQVTLRPHGASSALVLSGAERQRGAGSLRREASFGELGAHSVRALEATGFVPTTRAPPGGTLPQ